PKSDMTVAAAGPAIKLAQSITFKPSKTRSPITSSSRRQAVGIVVADHVTGGPAGEMRADHEDRGIGQTGQHTLARHLRLGGIGVRGRRPLRASDLAGVMPRRSAISLLPPSVVCTLCYAPARHFLEM